MVDRHPEERRLDVDAAEPELGGAGDLCRRSHYPERCERYGPVARETIRHLGDQRRDSLIQVVGGVPVLVFGVNHRMGDSGSVHLRDQGVEAHVPPLFETQDGVVPVHVLGRQVDGRSQLGRKANPKVDDAHRAYLPLKEGRRLAAKARLAS